MNASSVSSHGFTMNSRSNPKLPIDLATAPTLPSVWGSTRTILKLVIYLPSLSESTLGIIVFWKGRPI